MGIDIAGFAGANLGQSARLLPDGAASMVIDARPGRGELRQMLGPSATVATVVANPQRNTIWRMGKDVANDANYWLAWSQIVHAIRGFDGDDSEERTYYTGFGPPRWTNNDFGLSGGPPYPQAVRELGVPAPTSFGTLTLDTNGTGSEFTRFYVHTFVNDLGWESAPSPLSNGLLCKNGAIVDIASLPAAPAGNYGITLRRIYRTQAGTTGEAEFFFLREIAIGATSTQDDARALGSVLLTSGWIPPPANGHSLIGLWNSVTSMLSGKRVLFSEPGAIYTYPERYDITLQDKPVASGKWAQNYLVVTTGRPVLINGSDSAGMQDQALELSQPCVSVRSVVSFGHGVVWASPEGLAYAGAGGQMNLTGSMPGVPGLENGLLTEKQWRNLIPSTFIAGRYGRFYVAFYDDGEPSLAEDPANGTPKGLMIDPLNPAAGIWFLSQGYDACHYDDISDTLYVLDGANVKKFDAGTALEAKWTSKTFAQTRPMNFGWCKVVADYPVTVKIYADGSLKANKTVTSAQPVALPSGFLAEYWKVLIEASSHVQAVRLAVSPQEFR